MNPVSKPENILVIVTGSRDWTDEELIHSRLDAALEHALLRGGVLRVVEGGARGADQAAVSWCVRKLWEEDRDDVDHLQFRADWERDGKRAGPIRNQRMLDYALESRAEGFDPFCLAFPLPQSIGTRHMMKICRDAGIPVWSP